RIRTHDESRNRDEDKGVLFLLDSAVFKYEVVRGRARQRARVPKQTVVEKLGVARVVLQGREDAGDRDHLAHVRESVKQRVPEVGDDRSGPTGLGLDLDVNQEIHKVGRKDPPENDAEEVRIGL